MYGARSITGNNQEWCGNLFERNVHPEADSRIEAPDAEPDRGSIRAVRGASWWGREVDARCAYRFGIEDYSRYVTLGFRPVYSYSP